MARQFKALLFDLGRVVIDIDSTRALAFWAQKGGLSAAAARRRYEDHVLPGQVFKDHERGVVSDAAFFQGVRQALEADLSDEDLHAGWNAIFLGEMPGIRAILADLHGKIPLYAFSNTNGAHKTYWAVAYADLLSKFEKIYVSHELGLRKPDIEAYRAVLQDMRMQPDEVLFFDDSSDNIAGAVRCGLHTVHVRSVADIAQAIAGLHFA